MIGNALMLKYYIKPESLSASEVQLILNFFNNAQSKEEIADTIEIPGELDVGLRVAQRLLNQRQAVGGRFTDILQVANTPYVGPERFTEIVAVLTGRSITKAGDAGDVSASVLQEVRELKEMIRALQTNMGLRYRISLRLAQTGVYLGQSSIILIEVHDLQKNKPKANMRVTIASSWGTLETQVGFETRQGSVVTAQTDINGRAKLKLSGPTYEKLTQAQQTALDSALRTLDPNAQTPDEVAVALRSLVSQYQANGNIALRQAIDIYFRTRRDALAGAINPPSSSFAWPYFDALLTAYIHEDSSQSDNGNTVESTSLLKVRVKDWLDPWYQTYIKTLNEVCTISDDFAGFTGKFTDNGVLLDNMVNRLYSYSSGEFGLVGESVAEKVAQWQVNKFLNTGLADIPFDTKQMLFPALGLAAKNITSGQMGTLVVMGEVRTDINRKVDTKIGGLGDIGAFMEEVAGVKNQLGAFNESYQQFNTQYGSFEENYGSFEENYGSFDENFGVFQESYNQFTSNYSVFLDQIDQFQLDYGAFNSNYTQFQHDFGQFDVSNTQLKESLQGFEKDLGQFQSSYTQFTSRYNTFNTGLSQFNEKLGNFDTSISAFTQKYNDFSTKYDDFLGKNTVFTNNLASVNSKLADFNSKYSSFSTNYVAFNNNISQFNTKLGTFNQDYTDFKVQLRNIPTDPTGGA